MPFTDKLKAAADAATVKAAELADQHGDKVAAAAGGLVEKAGAVVDAKTGGKYAEHIEKAKGAVVDGVARGTEVLADKATAPAVEHEAEVTTEDRNV